LIRVPSPRSQIVLQRIPRPGWISSNSPCRISVPVVSTARWLPVPEVTVPIPEFTISVSPILPIVVFIVVATNEVSRATILIVIIIFLVIIVRSPSRWRSPSGWISIAYSSTGWHSDRRQGSRSSRCSCSSLIKSIIPVPIFLGVGAVDLGHEVADEGLLVERREIGAQEIIACAKETVMVDLEKGTRATLELSRHVCRINKNSTSLIAITMIIKNTKWILMLGIYRNRIATDKSESGRQIGAACQTFEIFEGASVVFFLIARRANLARNSLHRPSSRGNETVGDTTISAHFSPRTNAGDLAARYHVAFTRRPRVCECANNCTESHKCAFYGTVTNEKDSRLCENWRYYLERTTAVELSRGII